VAEAFEQIQKEVLSLLEVNEAIYTTLMRALSMVEQATTSLRSIEDLHAARALAAATQSADGLRGVVYGATADFKKTGDELVRRLAQ